MTIKEAKDKVLWLLELEGGEFRSSDADITGLLGVPNYDEVKSALISLEAEGRIAWYRDEDGEINRITLMLK